MKSNAPTPGTQRHLYSTENGVRVGYPTQMKSTQKKLNVHGRRKKFASPKARDTNMLVFFALGNAKVLSFALADAKVPNASSFAFWWNIGLNKKNKNKNKNCTDSRAQFYIQPVTSRTAR